jgi:hypothetical protein
MNELTSAVHLSMNKLTVRSAGILVGVCARGTIPGSSSWLLCYPLATGAVRTYNRALIAAALTGRCRSNVILRVTAQRLLAYCHARRLGPLDLARNIADFPRLQIRLLAGAS